MATAKKILIFHASAGHGHLKAAQAVAEALADQGQSPEVIDVLDLLPSFFGRFYKESYLSMIQKTPGLWGFLYYLMDNRALGCVIRPARRLVNQLFTAGLRKKMIEARPDVVVCTHFMAVEVAGALKRREAISAKIVTVVTDYLAHAFWVDRSTDVYAVGCDQTRRDLEGRGVPPGKIEVTGLPTMHNFSRGADRAACRAKLALPPDSPVLLLASGGAGVGPVEDVVRGLSNRLSTLRMLVVCGTNRALFDRLTTWSKNRPEVRVFGFVSNMHELMGAADLLVGKAGGLTVSESLCLGLPLVMVRPVPGQEERNALVVSAAGAGVTVHTTEQTLRETLRIMGDAAALDRMKHAAREFGRPQASAQIAQKVLA